MPHLPEKISTTRQIFSGTRRLIFLVAFIVDSGPASRHLYVQSTPLSPFAFPAINSSALFSALLRKPRNPLHSHSALLKISTLFRFSKPRNPTHTHRPLTKLCFVSPRTPTHSFSPFENLHFI